MPRSKTCKQASLDWRDVRPSSRLPWSTERFVRLRLPRSDRPLRQGENGVVNH
jgi:hypothetical protein